MDVMVSCPEPVCHGAGACARTCRRADPPAPPYPGSVADVKQVQVTFDCANPRAVAEFWKAVLGYVDPPIPPGFDSWDAFDVSLPVESQARLGPTKIRTGSAHGCSSSGCPSPRRSRTGYISTYES